MATAFEDNTRPPTHLKIPCDRTLLADITGKEDTIEPRQRQEEEEVDSTKAKAAYASTHAP
jgi:hypothetical protein